MAKVNHFQRLWNNQTSKLEIIEFPEAAKRSLLRLRPSETVMQRWVGECVGGWVSGRVGEQSGERKQYGHPTNPSTHRPTHAPTLPPTLQLRPYQQQAIANWFANKGQGTLKMATRSGKTITALAIAAELYRKSLQQHKPLQGLLIVCPYRHLVTQWAEAARQFGLQPILAFEAVQSWQGELQSQLLAVLSAKQSFITVITTNATLIRDSLQSQLQFFRRDR